MRKYAFIKDFRVHSVEELDDESFLDASRFYEAAVDVTDCIPYPEVGWNLVGNELHPPSPLLTMEEITNAQQYNQRVFGQKLAPILVDKMGARNLKLAAEGTVPNVSSLLNALGAVKALMETGALKTARGVMVQLRPSFPLYEDILNYAISDISNFLISMNYE
jgi:hypothetical protein